MRGVLVSSVASPPPGQRPLSHQSSGGIGTGNGQHDGVGYAANLVHEQYLPQLTALTDEIKTKSSKHALLLTSRRESLVKETVRTLSEIIDLRFRKNCEVLRTMGGEIGRMYALRELVGPPVEGDQGGSSSSSSSKNSKNGKMPLDWPPLLSAEPDYSAQSERDALHGLSRSDAHQEKEGTVPPPVYTNHPGYSPEMDSKLPLLPTSAHSASAHVPPSSSQPSLAAERPKPTTAWSDAHYQPTRPGASEAHGKSSGASPTSSMAMPSPTTSSSTSSFPSIAPPATGHPQPRPGPSPSGTLPRSVSHPEFDGKTTVRSNILRVSLPFESPHREARSSDESFNEKTVTVRSVQPRPIVSAAFLESHEAGPRQHEAKNQQEQQRYIGSNHALLDQADSQRVNILDTRGSQERESAQLRDATVRPRRVEYVGNEADPTLSRGAPGELRHVVSHHAKVGRYRDGSERLRPEGITENENEGEVGVERRDTYQFEDAVETRASNHLLPERGSNKGSEGSVEMPNGSSTDHALPRPSPRSSDLERSSSLDSNSSQTSLVERMKARYTQGPATRKERGGDKVGRLIFAS